MLPEVKVQEQEKSYNDGMADTARARKLARRWILEAVAESVYMSAGDVVDGCTKTKGASVAPHKARYYRYGECKRLYQPVTGRCVRDYIVRRMLQTTAKIGERDSPELKR